MMPGRARRRLTNVKEPLAEAVAAAMRSPGALGRVRGLAAAPALFAVLRIPENKYLRRPAQPGNM